MSSCLVHKWLELQCLLGVILLWWVWTSIYSMINFGLKSTLSNIKMTILSCVLVSLARKNKFPSFYPEGMSILGKVCFKEASKKMDYVFYFKSFRLCPLLEIRNY